MSKSTCTIMIAALLAFCGLAAHAEPVDLTIPGEGFQIHFDAPPILQFKGGSTKGNYQYMGGTADGLTISVFVEPPTGEARGHKACADFYWAQASKNPIIDQTTVVREDGEDHVKLSYIIRTEAKGQKIVAHNYNLFMEYKGRWIDVHLSRFPYADTDQPMLDALIASVKLVPTPIAAPVPAAEATAPVPAPEATAPVPAPTAE